MNFLVTILLFGLAFLTHKANASVNSLDLYYCPVDVGGTVSYSFRVESNVHKNQQWPGYVSGIRFGLSIGISEQLIGWAQTPNSVSAPFSSVESTTTDVRVLPDSTQWTPQGVRDFVEWEGGAVNAIPDGKLWWSFEWSGVRMSDKEAIYHCVEEPSSTPSSPPSPVPIDETALDLYYCPQNINNGASRIVYNFRMVSNVENLSSGYVNQVAFAIEVDEDLLADGESSDRLSFWSTDSVSLPFSTISTTQTKQKLGPSSKPWTPQGVDDSVGWTGSAVGSAIEEGNLWWEFAWDGTLMNPKQAILQCPNDPSSAPSSVPSSVPSSIPSSIPSSPPSPTPNDSSALDLYYCVIEEEGPDSFFYYFRLESNTENMNNLSASYIFFGVDATGFAQGNETWQYLAWETSGMVPPYHYTAQDYDSPAIALFPREEKWTPQDMDSKLEWYGLGEYAVPDGELWWKFTWDGQEQDPKQAIEHCTEAPTLSLSPSSAPSPDPSPDSSLENSGFDADLGIDLFYCAAPNEFGSFDYTFRMEQTSELVDFDYIFGIEIGGRGKSRLDEWENLENFANTSAAPLNYTGFEFLNEKKSRILSSKIGINIQELELTNGPFGLAPWDERWYPAGVGDSISWTGTADNFVSEGQLHWGYTKKQSGQNKIRLAFAEVRTEAMLDVECNSTTPSKYQDLIIDPLANSLGLTHSDVTIDLSVFANNDTDELQELIYDSLDQMLSLTKSNVTVDVSGLDKPFQELNFDQNTKMLGMDKTEMVDLSAAFEGTKPQRLALDGNILELSRSTSTQTTATLPSGEPGTSSSGTIGDRRLADVEENSNGGGGGADIGDGSGNLIDFGADGSTATTPKTRVDLSFLRVTQLSAQVTEMNGPSNMVMVRRLAKKKVNTEDSTSTGKRSVRGVQSRQLVDNENETREIAPLASTDYPEVSYGGQFATGGWGIMSEGRLLGVSIAANEALTKGYLMVEVVDCTDMNNLVDLAVRSDALELRPEHGKVNKKMFTNPIAVQAETAICFQVRRVGDVESANTDNAATIILLLEQW